jgi:hypothetical protein
VSAVDLLTDGLATFRLTKFVIDDELLADARDRFLDKHPPESTKLGYLIGCPWCVSIYLGGAVVLARALAPRQWDLVARALSLSAVTGLIAEKT